MPNRTTIPWVVNPDGSQGFTSNPIRGKCLHACPYCYAEGIRRWYKQPEELSWHPKELSEIERHKKPATYFIGSMHDIFGNWVPELYIAEILKLTRTCLRHTFLFLTKNVGYFPYVEDHEPSYENTWFGVTDDCRKSDTYPLDNFAEWLTPARKFVSFEPLLGPLNTDIPIDVSWVIIGSYNINGCPVPAHKGGTRREWIEQAIEAAGNRMVFIKPEPYQLYPTLPKRQEIPWIRK